MLPRLCMLFEMSVSVLPTTGLYSGNNNNKVKPCAGFQAWPVSNSTHTQRCQLTGFSCRKLNSFGLRIAGAKKRRKTNPLTAV